MADDMQCPYCGADQEVCHDDGQGCEEGVKHQHECSACEKTFVFTTAISFDYEPEKADCLNGSPHDYQRTCTFPRRFTKMRCSACGEERELNDDEKKELMRCLE